MRVEYEGNQMRTVEEHRQDMRLGVKAWNMNDCCRISYLSQLKFAEPLDLSTPDKFTSKHVEIRQ